MESVNDYLSQLEEVSDIFVLSPKLVQEIKERARKRLVAIRLANWEVEKSKQLAKIKKIPYQRLMRQWIDEGLRREFTHIER